MAHNRLMIGSVFASGLVHAIPVALVLHFSQPEDFKSYTHPASIQVDWIDTTSSSQNLPAQIKNQEIAEVAPQRILKESITTPCAAVSTSTAEQTNQSYTLTSDDLIQANLIPTYPEEARLLGLEGTVHIELSTSFDGKVDHIKVHTPKAHPLLEIAAVEQIKQWQFPKRHGGAILKFPIKFVLEG